MSERIINSAWRFVLITLIFILACAAMFQFYQGVLNLFGGEWALGVSPVIAAAVMGAAVYWLARHREELVEI